MEDNKPLRLIILSDGTGETAASLFRAAMAQFPNYQIYMSQFKNIRSEEQLEKIIETEAPAHDLIVFTLVQAKLRKFLMSKIKLKQIRAFDMLGPYLDFLSKFFDHKMIPSPGVLREVNEDYFKRVEAMEFTLNHDDGKTVQDLDKADIVLIGISRTSKTPLSIYLSQKGYKVINVPLIPDADIPEDLFTTDQRKIFALTIEPKVLHEIRTKRLNALGSKFQHNYADLKSVIDEVEWAENLFKKNRKWTKFNVSGKALEETAADIIKIINRRKENIFLS